MRVLFKCVCPRCFLAQHLARCAVQFQATALQQSEAAQKERQQLVDSVTGQLSGITERVNAQQATMEAQASENERLREQLGRVGNVLQLSDKLKGEYDAELARLRGALEQQVRAARLRCAEAIQRQCAAQLYSACNLWLFGSCAPLTISGLCT